jgi:hypothetical protein
MTVLSLSSGGIPMKTAEQTVAGVVVGMALGLVLVGATEWVLAVVVLARGATSTAATWVASRIGGRRAGVIAALLRAWAIAFNLTKLLYAMWFKAAMFGAFPIACLFGIRYGRRV